MKVMAARSGRKFYTWVNFAFNRVDRKRVKEVGPDKAAAEWILRLGGSVKFTSREHWSDNYNTMPSGSRDTLHLEAINAAGISITDIGLEHLEGLQKLSTLSMSRCHYITDASLSHLVHVKQSLRVLDISHCVGITEKGLTHLHALRLKSVNLSGTLLHAQQRHTIINEMRALCEVIDEKFD